jgi:hypothetical protein
MDNGSSLLSELKKGMFLTRTIPEPIMQSLTYLPFAVFEDVKSVELDYDLNFDNSAQSYFAIKVKGVDSSAADFDDRKKAIIRSVKELLWHDLRVDLIVES